MCRVDNVRVPFTANYRSGATGGTTRYFAMVTQLQNGSEATDVNPH